MKLETFFNKFDQFADAPDAIGTLREVILQLAVSGRLVSQSKTDVPVDVGRLDEQAAPRKQAEGRSGASLEAVTEDEIADEIPESWAWVRLFRLCEPDAPIVYGILQPGPDVRPNGVPYVRPTEIKGGQIRLSEIRHTSPEIAAQYTRATIRKGDVLLTIVGTLGATAVVPEELDGGNITQSSCRLRPDSRFIDTSYLVICLRSRTLFSQYRGFSLGSAVQRLNIAHVRALAIPLPPLAEQKRIVAKVDELMALCDRLDAQQHEREEQASTLARASLARFADAPTPANLPFLFHPSYAVSPADLHKAILTLAVQGKLVRQDPNDEPAETLIARIAQQRRAKKAKDYSPVDSDAVPFEAPYSWSWVRLGNLSLSSDSGWSPQCGSESRSGNEWGVLKVSAVSWGGFDPEANKALPTGMKPRPECEVRTGDFLLSRANTEELVARSVVVEQTPPRLMMSDKIVRFTFPDEIEKAFINLANLSDPSREYYIRNASGTSSSMKNIGREVMCNLPIAIPPLAEQRRIVAKVEQLMALVDALETQLAASRATAANLLAAAVAELTAQ